MDTIIIQGLPIFAYHGVGEQEKINGQTFVLDIHLDADLSAARKSDRLDDTVNYAAVIKFAKARFCEKRFDLIEAAGDYLLNAILDTFPAVCTVTVTLKKPEAPLSLSPEYVAVRLQKTRI